MANESATSTTTMTADTPQENGSDVPAGELVTDGVESPTPLEAQALPSGDKSTVESRLAELELTLDKVDKRIASLDKSMGGLASTPAAATGGEEKKKKGRSKRRGTSADGTQSPASSGAEDADEGTEVDSEDEEDGDGIVGEGEGAGDRDGAGGEDPNNTEHVEVEEGAEDIESIYRPFVPRKLETPAKILPARESATGPSSRMCLATNSMPSRL